MNVIRNWKFFIHILFGTYRFGVDNQWKSSFDSMYGIPIKERFNIFNLVKRYRMARARAFCGFIPMDDAVKLFPIYAKKNNYR